MADESREGGADQESDDEDLDQPGDVFAGTRILIEDVVVRYTEDMGRITLTVEGTLPAKTVAKLITDLKRKLETILNKSVTVKRL